MNRHADVVGPSPGRGLPFRFTDERNLQFVKLYEREPCLWNQRPYLRRARTLAHRRIQMGMNSQADPGECGLSLEGVKTKIKNIRTAYHQELKKIRANSSYKPRMPWFAPLHKFLAEFLDKVNNGNAPQLKRLQIRLTRLKPIKIKTEPEEVPPPPPPQFTFTALPVPQPRTPTPPPLPPSAVTTPTLSVPQISAVAQVSTTKVERRELRDKDEFTYFGLSVAAQLRNMPLEIAMLVQSKIQHTLSMERRKICGHTTDF